MMSKRIAIINDGGAPFDGAQYEIDLDRKFEGYDPSDIMCVINPFWSVPLKLEIAIRGDGKMFFRSWKFNTLDVNGYLHTTIEGNTYLSKAFVPTDAQIDTVSGLFSGRIRFEGLKLAVGASLQKICPIDIAREELLIGEKIYLN